jgi:transcription termination factor NusB
MSPNPFNEARHGGTEAAAENRIEKRQTESLSVKLTESVLDKREPIDEMLDDHVKDGLPIDQPSNGA